MTTACAEGTAAAIQPAGTKRLEMNNEEFHDDELIEEAGQTSSEQEANKAQQLIDSQPHVFPTSIDAIRLFTAEFDVEDELPNFAVLRSINPDLNRELYVANGRPVKGMASVLTRGHIRVTIAPVGTGHLWGLRRTLAAIAPRDLAQRPVGCWVSFTPSRMFYNNNATLVDRQELAQAFDDVQSLLERQGLRVNVRAMKLSRLELVRDVTLPRSCSFYLPLLHGMGSRYGRDPKNFPNGAWRGNKTVRVTYYGKRQEMLRAAAREFHRTQEGSPPPPPPRETDFLPGPETMRLEWRLRSPDAIKRHLSIKTVEQLLTRFPRLRHDLDRLITNSLLPVVPQESWNLQELTGPHRPVDHWAHILSSAESFQTENNLRGAMTQAFASIGFECLAQDLGWPQADTLLRRIFPDAKRRADWRSYFRVWRLQYLMSPDGIPYSILYKEFYCSTFERKKRRYRRR